MIQNFKKFYPIYFFIPFIFTGCAPGPPPPPIFPGFEWLIIIILLLIVMIARKEYLSVKPRKTDYLTEALNDIQRQLKELEQKINALEKNQNRREN